jgi:hypothetical protein
LNSLLDRKLSNSWQIILTITNQLIFVMSGWTA